MVIRKWIITNSLTDMPGIVSHGTVDLCWLPTSGNEFYDMKNISCFLQLRRHFNVVICMTGPLMTEFAKDRNTFLEQLFRYFSQAGYAKQYNKPVLAGANEPAATMRQYFELQGFAGIVHLEIQPASIIDCDSSASGDHGAAIKTKLEHKIETIGNLALMNQAYDNEQSIFIRPANNNDIGELLLQMDEWEQSISNANGQLRYIQALIKSETQNRLLQYELSLTRKDRKNTTAFFEIQKQNSREILSWYEKEYEVLPLWYKRLGHVIKAMTGKRSWKSLVGQKKDR